MTKRILAILALCLAFTACKADKNQKKEDENKPVQEAQIQENEGEAKKEAEKAHEEEKNDEEKTSKDEENPDSEIFSILEGREFNAYITNRSDFIYFYKDGTFDGCTRYGAEGAVGCLYTGRFGKPRKLDDKSYALTLEEIKYQTPTEGEFEGSDGHMYYYPSIYFDESMKGEEYIVYLPGTNLHDLQQVGVSHEFYTNENIENGVMNMYTIAKNPVKALDYPGEVIFMNEDKDREPTWAEPELKAKDPTDNCFSKYLFGDKPNPYKGK